MNKMKLGARCATLAAVSAAGFLVAAQAAQAQVWFETRGWPEARYYEEAPPFYREAPRYVAPTALPTRAVRRILEGQGFDVIGAMQFTGDVYIVQAVDERGRVRRLVVDAQDGEIVESASLVTQPRPPGDMGRARGPYVTSPGVDLPPGRMAPRSSWSAEQYGVPPPAVNPHERRARERFARQSPDGMEAPRGRIDNFAPGPQVEPRKAAPPKQRAVKKPQPKTAPKQQATRTPSAETPNSVKAEPSPPDAVRLDAARPQPAKVEAARPAVAKPDVSKPDGAKPETARTDSSATGSTRSDPAKTEAASAPAARTEQPKAAAQTPQAAKPEAATRSNSMLRRPSQKAEGSEATGERRGVAAGPTVSSGAEPQRKAPRVVYPGPGAPASSASGED
ncbi:MAG: hypothetical protein Q8M31_15320 [Beijerinckiaceae bacterium]|nr:hypothetical protein [Beijerinckiaceae bacterium]